VRQGLDIFGIQLAQFIYPVQDLVQIAQYFLLFLFVKLQPGQVR
jgi:hypothetical protein